MIEIGNPKRLVMAGITMGCALGIGYFMQIASPQDVAMAAVPTEAGPVVNGASVALPVMQSKPQEVALDMSSEASAPEPEITDTLPVAESDAIEPAEQDFANPADAYGDKAVLAEDQTSIDAPETAPQPETLPDAPVRIAALGDAPIGAMPEEEPVPSMSCEMDMSATPIAAAVVKLELNAPCHTNQQFILHHNGMMFSALTDDTGAAYLEVPALSENAMFIAAFDNGEGAVATAEVDTLSYYDRYVVQWSGASGLQLHALEYGADYGGAGHVWREAPQDMAVVVTGEGGFLARLGEGAIEEGTLFAEVYTFPSRNARNEGDVALSIEAEVEAANCGRDIEAQALVRQSDGAFDALDLMLAMPDCDAVGDFLVLKNVYEDLKIARN